jgi:hypothetical protein
MMKRKTALGRLETATRASDNAMASLGVLSLLVAHLTKGGVFDLPGFRADIARLAAVYRKQGLKGRARIYDELNGVIADVATVRLTTGLEAAVSSLAAKSPKAKMKKKLVAAALVVAMGMAPSAFAQTSVLQSGTMTSGHAPMYATSGTSGQAVVQDSGPAAGGQIGLGLSEFLGVSRSVNGVSPAPGSGTGPLGTHACWDDAPAVNATGYHYLCWDPNAQGGGLIAYGAAGTATHYGMQVAVNGVFYPFPGAGNGNVIGPVSPYPTAGNVVEWNGTTDVMDGGLAVANLMLAPARVTAGDILTTTSNRQQSADSGVVVANVMLAPTSVGANDLFCGTTTRVQSADCNGLQAHILGTKTAAITASGYDFLASTDGTLPDTLIGANVNYQAIAGVAHAISGTTMQNTVGLAGYVLNDNGTSPSYNSVALYGWGLSDTNSTDTWGINTVLQQKAGVTGTALLNEFDFNNSDSTAILNGVLLTGRSTVQPSLAVAFSVGSLSVQSPGSVLWTYGLYTANGASTYGAQFGAAAASGNSINGQPVEFGFFDSSGSIQNFGITATPTSMNFATTSSAAATWQFGGNVEITTGNFSYLAGGDEEINNSGHVTTLAGGGGITAITIGNNAANITLAGPVIPAAFMQFTDPSVWVATSNCGSPAGATKCLAIKDPNGNFLYVPAYGTY